MTDKRDDPPKFSLVTQQGKTYRFAVGGGRDSEAAAHLKPAPDSEDSGKLQPGAPDLPRGLLGCL